jgi:hypothetical protein
MLRRALLLMPLVLLLGRPGQIEAGPVMIPVNTTMANANGMLSVTADFTINTGPEQSKPALGQWERKLRECP